MMTFKQFLAEAFQGDLVQFLKENCRPACEDIIKAENFFYRGTHAKPTDQLKLGDKEVDVIIASPRADRRPRDTPRWAHDTIDDFFEKKFGQRLRSTSLFVMGKNEHHAGGYGDVYAIIPVGKYRTYFSPGITDLTEDLFATQAIGPGVTLYIGGERFWEAEGYKLADVTEEMQVAELKRRLAGLYYTSDNARALNHVGEVMLTCKKYLGVPLKFRQERGIKEHELRAAVYEALS